MSIGEKIFELRRSKNLSQENLADVLGVTRQTVSKWETNQSLPDLDKVMPLCKVFEISVEELLGNSSDVTANKSTNSGNAEKEKSGTGVTSDVMASESEIEIEKSKLENDSVKEKYRKRTAIVVSGAIFAYVFAAAFLLAGVAVLRFDPIIVFSIFLIIVGGATATIIWNFMSIPKSLKEEKTITKEQKITRQINGIIWTVSVVIYFLLSFLTRAWNITWIIFIIAVLCSKIIDLIFSLRNEKNGGENNLGNKNEKEL